MLETSSGCNSRLWSPSLSPARWLPDVAGNSSPTCQYTWTIYNLVHDSEWSHSFVVNVYGLGPMKREKRHSKNPQHSCFGVLLKILLQCVEGYVYLTWVGKCCVCVWRSEVSVVELVLSSYVVSRDQTSIFTLKQRALYVLNHLTGPRFGFP